MPRSDMVHSVWWAASVPRATKSRHVSGGALRLGDLAVWLGLVGADSGQRTADSGHVRGAGAGELNE